MFRRDSMSCPRTSSSLTESSTASMALFGMLWLLRIRTELRHCSKCNQDEVIVGHYPQRVLHHQQQQQSKTSSPRHYYVAEKGQHQQQSAALPSANANEDNVNSNNEEKLFTSVDSSGATPTTIGNYCKIHGYLTPKGILLERGLCLSMVILIDYYYYYCNRDFVVVIRITKCK